MRPPAPYFCWYPSSRRKRSCTRDVSGLSLFRQGGSHGQCAAQDDGPEGGSLSATSSLVVRRARSPRSASIQQTGLSRFLSTQRRTGFAARALRGGRTAVRRRKVSSRRYEIRSGRVGRTSWGTGMGQAGVQSALRSFGDFAKHHLPRPPRSTTLTELQQALDSSPVSWAEAEEP